MPVDKAKILIIVSNLEYGGAQRQILELIQNIDESRYEMHIASLSDYVPLAAQIGPEYPVHIVHKHSRFDFSVVPRLVKLINQYQIDILHTYLFDAEIAGRLAGWLSKRKPAVIGAERNTNYTFKKVQLIAYKLTNRMFDVVIANSQTGAEFNAANLGIPADKYRVIYNGVNTDKFKPLPKLQQRARFELPESSTILGVFASFKSQKNHQFLFKALIPLLPDYPNLKILLVGDMLYAGMHGSDEYYERVQRLIEESGLKDACIRIGNQDEVEALYPACDFTVLPSLFEGTPNVVLESMACGVPAIVTRVADNHRIVDHGDNGLLVELDNISEMQAALRKMLDHPDETKAMGVRAREKIQAAFSSPKLAENTCLVYDELLSK